MLLAIDIGNSTTSVGLFGLDRELKFLATLDMIAAEPRTSSALI